MSKRKKKGAGAPPEVLRTEVPSPEPGAPGLADALTPEEVQEQLRKLRASPMRRVSVLIAETDLHSVQVHFAEGLSAMVTVHPPPASQEKQAVYRSVYRKRPEVRAKHKAYRALRAARLRAEKDAPSGTEVQSTEA